MAASVSRGLGEQECPLLGLPMLPVIAPWFRWLANPVFDPCAYPGVGLCPQICLRERLSNRPTRVSGPFPAADSEFRSDCGQL